MDSDILGNLREWNQVLDHLDGLKESKKLDEYQDGLTRILRFRENWRLLERVLEYGKEISQPTDEFLLEVTNIMTNRNIYLDARILAVHALEDLVPRRLKNCKSDQEFRKNLVVRKMMDLLNAPEPPIFREAVTKSLETIKGRWEG